MEVDRNQVVTDYVAAFAQDGSRAHIANLNTQVEVHRWGNHLLPMTVNDGEPQKCFVCSPRVGYIDYTLEELSHFPDRRLVPVLRAVLGGMGTAMALSDVNRIVHVNNWMMSTNLPVDLDPTEVLTQTKVLTALFPRHLIAMRSLVRRYSDRVMTALAAAGWLLLPSRQIFVVDDVPRDSLRRTDARNDDRLWRRGAFSHAELADMTDADADRIAALYRLLYLDKYSHLNPQFTPRFIKMTHQIGMIRYLVLRDGQGVIQGFGGLHRFGEYATMPLIGYDTGLPRDQGLYRLVCHAGALHAADHGLRYNMSSGAGPFKITRGATPEIEYTAYHIRHLALHRRLPFGLLGLVADRIGVPLLRKYQL